MGQSPVFDLDVSKLSSALAEISPAYWIVPDGNGQVSYPNENHQHLENNQEDSFWYFHRAKCLEEVFHNFPTGHLLDVGGSNGHLTKYLSQVTNVALLEPSKNGASNAFNNGISPVIQASFEEADFHRNSIPAIGLFDVLEHVEEDSKFLQGIHDTLMPNGHLYVTVPAFQFLWSQFDVSVGHFRRYNKKRLITDLEQAGFEVAYFSYMFLILPLPIWLVRKMRGSSPIKNADVKLHKKRAGLTGKILNLILKPERWFFKQKFALPFGSSCVCVARKIDHGE